MHRRLKTHDRLRPWDVGGAVNLNLLCCSLCHTGPDSHEHLFFECKYSNHVWSLLKSKAGMPNVSNHLDDVVTHLVPCSKGNSAKGVIGRLVLAATIYFIWQERNNRMFSNNTRTPEKLRDTIIHNVRMRLATITFKSNARVVRLLEEWRLPTCLLLDGDDPAYVE